MLAKLATRRAKPAGVFHLNVHDVAEFIAPLDVEDFPSIGYSIRRRIEDKFGSSKCDELLQHSQGAFKALLGQKTGEMVYGYLRGIDSKKLEPHKERKSISAEMNVSGTPYRSARTEGVQYGIRFQTQDQAEIYVKDLAVEVSKRMKQVNARGRLLTLKVMTRHPDAPVEPPKVSFSLMAEPCAHAVSSSATDGVRQTTNLPRSKTKVDPLPTMQTYLALKRSGYCVECNWIPWS